MLSRSLPIFVGLIGTRDPNGHGWSLPVPHARVAYRAEDGVAIVEPATIDSW